MPRCCARADIPAVHAAIRWIGRRCLAWFYRDWLVIGAEQVPASGPVLLIGNHPHDVPDVILGFFTTPRPVRYIATISQATNPIAKKTYDWLGVIPVTRVRDARKMKEKGIDIAAMNRAANAAVLNAFARGDAVAVFPEGGVHDVCEIGRLRTGVASMLLEFLDGEPTRDVTVVPFGIQYEAQRTAGSDIVMRIGAPFSVRAWRGAQPTDAAGVSALTDALHASLCGVTRNAPTWEIAQVRDELVAAMAAAHDPKRALQSTPSLVPRARAIAIDAMSDAPSHDAREQQLASHTLARAVERAGGIGTSAADHARLLFALDVHTAPRPIPSTLLWMALPIATVGAVVHLPITSLVTWMAHRWQTVRTDIPARQFVPGLYVVALWYLLLAPLWYLGLTALGMPPVFAGVLALLIIGIVPHLGDFWFTWWRAHRASRFVARVRNWSTEERVAARDAARVFAADGVN